MKPTRFAAAFAAITLTACGLVLGIEDLPLRPDKDAGGDVSAIDGGCAPKTATGCACTNFDFCDDFDHDPDSGIPFEKWESGLPTQPFIRGDSGMSIVNGGVSLPNALQSNVFSPQGNSAYAAIFNQMSAPAGKAVSGVRLKFFVKIGTLSVLPGGGPVTDAATAYVGSVIKLIGFTPPQPGGAAVLFGMDGKVYLALSPNILQSNNTDIATLLFDKGGVGIAQTNWAEVELFVGTKAKAVEIGYKECNDVDGGTALPDGGERGVAAAWFYVNQYRGCLPLSDAFNGAGWTANPIIGIGSGTFNGGTLLIQHDNVTAEFL